MPDHPTPSYRICERSGDLKIEAWGRDCLEALAHASSALVSQIVPLEQISELDECSITVSGDDESSRCIAFLNELLFLVYAKHWLPRRVKLLKQCKQRLCRELEAVLVGETFDAGKHETKYEIKAVTYHDFQIHNQSEHVVLSFICDL
jgi:SHS2 domain-containing protein